MYKKTSATSSAISSTSKGKKSVVVQEPTDSSDFEEAIVVNKTKDLVISEPKKKPGRPPKSAVVDSDYITTSKSTSSKSSAASHEFDELMRAQAQLVPGFIDIWSKLTNGCKTNYRTFDADEEQWDYGKFKNFVDLVYFVMRHSFHFKNVIEKYRTVVCATLAEKESSMGWDTKLFILVKNISTNNGFIILQMYADEKIFKEYPVSSDDNILCSDVLRNEKVTYQMTICVNRKKLITIQFPSVKERNFWRKFLAVSDD
jgi:hypothetical protein